MASPLTAAQREQGTSSKGRMPGCPPTMSAWSLLPVVAALAAVLPARAVAAPPTNAPPTEVLQIGPLGHPVAVSTSSLPPGLLPAAGPGLRRRDQGEGCGLQTVVAAHRRAAQGCAQRAAHHDR